MKNKVMIFVKMFKNFMKKFVIKLIKVLSITTRIWCNLFVANKVNE